MKKSPRTNPQHILERATPLFARHGYDGVSMRDVATAVGVTPAALYHYFKDKDELYVQAVNHVFGKKFSDAKAIMANSDEPVKRLETFITWFVRVLNKDKDFQKLLQWVMLDSDPRRLQKLTKNTFQELFAAIQKLGESFKQQYDPHLLAVSIIGLVLYHFESSAVRKKLPGNRAAHDQAKTITRHITALLENGLLTH